MTVKDLYAWLHDNPFYPHRRKQALWYGLKYLKGRQLENFARYALSISYAFKRDDQALVSQLLKKAGLRIKGAPTPSRTRWTGVNGIGQFGGEEPGFSGDIGPDVDDPSGMPDWMNAMGNDEGAGGQIPGLGPIPGEPTPGQGSGSSNFLGGIVGNFAGSLLKGVFSGQGSDQATGGTIQVGTRQGDMVWNGKAWIYAPATPKPGTTSQAPTHSETEMLRQAGRLQVGLRTGTGWTWTGQGWVPTTQYTGTATQPGVTPPYTPPPTSKDDGTTGLILGGLVIGGLVLAAK